MGLKGGVKERSLPPETQGGHCWVGGGAVTPCLELAGVSPCREGSPSSQRGDGGVAKPRVRGRTGNPNPLGVAAPGGLCPADTPPFSPLSPPVFDVALGQISGIQLLLF